MIDTNISDMKFLAMFVSLPAKSSSGRTRVWRALKSLGSATLRDGVYLLPESPQHATALTQVAAEAKAAGGAADLYLLNGREAQQDHELVALFDRSAGYAALLQSIRTADPGDAKALRSVRREFAAVSAIDFFPGEARRQAEAALQALEADANGEPTDAAGRIRRLASADFQGRTWATRKHLWVDRMASAWPISRHIDHGARFNWLDDPKRCPKKVLGFDFDGAAFTHVGGLVTFEVLAASFGLDSDPAIARIAAIVHFLDVGGVPVAEAAGIEAVLAGARAGAADDDTLLAQASHLFDHLYTNYTQELSP